MHALILGVPGRYRGAALEEDLAAQGITFDVVAGADASQWTADDLADVYSPRAARVACRRQLAPTEVACALGHRSMIRALLESGDEWGLLLEDDARIPHQLAPMLAALTALPDAPIVIQLSSHRRPIPHPNPVTFDGGELWRQPRTVFGSSAYLMNRRGALVGHAAYRGAKVDSLADWPFRWRWSVEFRRPSHDLATVDAWPSMIVDERRAHRLAPRPSRGTISGIGRGVLKSLGVTALYGRALGLPLRPVYRRDSAEGRDQIRQHLGATRPSGTQDRT